MSKASRPLILMSWESLLDRRLHVVGGDLLDRDIDSAVGRGRLDAAVVSVGAPIVREIEGGDRVLFGHRERLGVCRDGAQQQRQ